MNSVTVMKNKISDMYGFVAKIIWRMTDILIWSFIITHYVIMARWSPVSFLCLFYNKITILVYIIEYYPMIYTYDYLELFISIFAYVLLFHILLVGVELSNDNRYNPFILNSIN